jgi:hypothetical protein
MGKILVTVGLATALLAGQVQAQPPSGLPDLKTRQLARAMVAADGDRVRLSKLDSIEVVIAAQIEKALDLTDPAKKEKIGSIVHERLQALEDDLIEARVSALAQTYTTAELEGYLAFGRSPTGQALRGAASELNRELTSAVLGESASEADVPPLSEQKVMLIERILKARDVESSARKGWRSLKAMATEVATNAAQPAASTEDQAAEDAYVKRVVAAETRFYAKTFSDEQLTDMATYFDGPIGRAFAERASQLMSIVAHEAPEFFEEQFDRLDREACEAVECSSSQRGALDSRLGQIRSMMAAGISAMAQ